MAATFDISPERRASLLHFLYRQIFVQPTPVLRRDVDLTGKTTIITGANSGLGFEAASQILDLGGNVVLAVRDERKGEEARQRLADGRQLTPLSIQVMKLDLLSYDSIISFVKSLKTLDHVDAAILNSGVAKFNEDFVSATGFEEIFQVNYLSTMLLAILLLPIIKEKKSDSGPGRISIVSSDMAAWAKFEERTSKPLLPIFKEKSLTGTRDRYATSKLLGQLFLMELTKKVSPSIITINCVNPGFCAGSAIARDLSGPIRIMYDIQCALLARTCAVGARPYVHAITTVGMDSHGQYIEDGKIQPLAVLAYKPEGLRLSELLYEETMDELSFAGVRNIVNEISRLK